MSAASSGVSSDKNLIFSIVDEKEEKHKKEELHRVKILMFQHDVKTFFIVPQGSHSNQMISFDFGAMCKNVHIGEENVNLKTAVMVLGHQGAEKHQNLFSC